MKEEKIRPAILTRTELQWLLGNIKISKIHEYRIKSDIRKKLKTFAEIEIPILIQKGFMDTNNLSIFPQNLITNHQSINSESSIKCSNIKNSFLKTSLGRDLDPGPLPYQGNALPG